MPRWRWRCEAEHEGERKERKDQALAVATCVPRYTFRITIPLLAPQAVSGKGDARLKLGGSPHGRAVAPFPPSRLHEARRACIFRVRLTTGGLV